MIRSGAVATIAAAVLAYEVLLVRLFAIVQWHHFAFMAISIAMLGFGVSGALLAVFRARAAPRDRRLFVAGAAGFAVSAPVAFLLAERVPFNALEVVWAPGQLLWLGLMYLILVVPFTLGAGCIGLAFMRAGERAGRVYFWDLLGSGLGALGIVGLMGVLHPLACLVAVAGLALLSAGLAAGARGAIMPVAVAIAGALAWAAAPADWVGLHLAEQKGLARALAVKDARAVAEVSGPQALLTVVESPTVPFRHAPGLSLLSPALPPAQLGVFADGEFRAAIDLWHGEPDELGYLGWSTDALAYRLAGPAREVLVLGAGDARRVLQAVLHGAGRIDAVEGNADLLRLATETFAARAGRPFARPEVTARVADARRYLEAADRRWDLIVLPPGQGGLGLGARGLSEDFLHTVGAYRLMLERLAPGGWVSATTAVDLPPRGALRIIATMRAALAAEGVAQPARHIVAIRGMGTVTVLMKLGPVGTAEIAALRAFAAERAFDPVIYPGMQPAEANRRNMLAEPAFFQGAEALLGPGAAAFIDAYKFDIRPATDDRPYPNDYFKWATLPELVRLGPAAGAALLDLGELVVAATLVQALVLGLTLVLLPLATRGYRAKPGARTLAWGGYFTALGLAFLVIEIAWIQKFVLFLGHPVYAVAVTLAGFLVFAGIGAGLSTRLEARLAHLRVGGTRVGAIPVALAGIAVLAIGYLAVLPPVLAGMPHLPLSLRMAVALALIAPLAVCMGMPFPLGLARVAREDPDFVPWAWGLNGCASVVSAAAATLMMMTAGFAVTVLAAVLVYLAGGLALGVAGRGASVARPA